jgi:redox-sensitive bicupin YhaK (pirin superfamily)
VSNIVAEPRVEVCAGRPEPGPVRELLPARAVPLGESTVVRRLLPTMGRRMVGAWCFVDHYGPDDIAREPGMQVPPHPHTGLQTVSWLLDGEVHHRDSLGSDVVIRPGELGLMTAGRAIAHSEQSPDPHAPLLHGAQLWVALPDAQRHRAPSFAHHVELPVLAESGVRATLLLGELGGARSPGVVHTPLVGVDVELHAGADAALPLEPDFEHAVLTVSGAPEVDGEALEPGSLCYLGTTRRELRVRAEASSRLLLLGGLPFDEEIVMWWNFVARTGDEVAAAREAWQAELAEPPAPAAAERLSTSAPGESGTPAVPGRLGIPAVPDRFGTVPGFDGPALAAPPMPATPLRPRGRVR